jgi:Flp pilus assembly protein TadG
MKSHARRPVAALYQRTYSRSQRGQNLIEFAMLAPFILMLIAIIVVIGLALNTRSSLQQAVREGARQMAVLGADPGAVPTARALAAGNAPDVLVPGDVKVCLPAGSTGQVGESVQVSVSKSVTLVSAAGILKALGMPSLSVIMNPKATARLEHSVSGLTGC